MVLEQLSRKHNRAEFDCGVESINRFLRETARQQGERDLSLTQVLVETAGSPIIVGFYTMLMGEVASDIIPLKRIPAETMVPAILLAQFGVDKRFQGKRLGERLLYEALWQGLQAANQVGSTFVLNAVDEKARGFYLRFGFEELRDDPLHLYLPTKTARAIFAKSVTPHDR
jgi:predicted N-acetyltransferase YhbS